LFHGLNIPVLLINLDRSADRLIRSAQQLEEIGTKYRRVTAVDGLTLDRNSVALYSTNRTWWRTGRDLTNAEIGCFLSHLNCMQMFLDSGEELCLIVEDDIEFREDAGVTIDATARWLKGKNDVDLVHLSRPVKKLHRRLQTSFPALEKAGICRAPYLPVTTGAILWTRHGAQTFLSDTVSIHAPFDEHLQSWSAKRGKGYAFINPPAQQLGVDSLIEKDREVTKKSRGAVGQIVRFIARAPVYANALSKSVQP
jgi:glycosyl transferase family 25